MPPIAPALTRLLTTLKPYLRWVILGLTLFFVATALREHWTEVVKLRLRSSGGRYITLGFGITLVAHGWSGWVWGWILHDLAQPVSLPWAIATFLRTNIAKYLPGNVWHFIGRVQAARQQAIAVSIAALSVAIEALCMAAAALMLAIAVLPNPGMILLGGLAIAIGLHPRCLNPIVTRFTSGKLRQFQSFQRFQHSQPGDAPPVLPNSSIAETPKSPKFPDSSALSLRSYPWRPLLGELGFVGLRGLGFLAVWLAIAPIAPAQLPPLIGGFGLAWLLGLVVPGAPGGIGIFEATALSVLSPHFPEATILGAIALYRLISVATEACGALLATVINRQP